MEYDSDNPWNRQPCDDEVSWPVFHRYLMQDRRPRSLQALVKEGSPYTWGQLQERAWQDAWSERARAWDRAGEREAEGAFLGAVRARAASAGESVAERSKRQAGLGARLQRLAGKHVDLAAKMLDKSPDFPILTHREMIRAADVGVRIERAALGETAEVSGSGPDLTALTVDELREWRRLMAKVKVA